MGSNYIVIEGLEGAGKTTARDVVVETLEQLGIRNMIFTREPGGTQLAEKLRSLVLDIRSGRSPRSLDPGVSGGRARH